MKLSRNARREARGARRGLHAGFRYLLPFTFCLVSAAASGCRQDMHNTPTGHPLRESLFVKGTSTSRPLVEGTVARGTLKDDAAFFTGKSAGVALDALPFPLTAQVLDRGEQRYNIYCSPCHGLSGNADGMIVKRGYRQPPSFHIDRMRTAPLGHYYDVMTNGFGAMPDYRAQISPRDRWTIAAYVRALQLSQHAPAAEFPQDERDKLSKPAAPAAPGGHK